MNNRRKYGLLVFVVWWGIWGGLLTGVPFKIEKAKIYPPEKGCGATAYVGHDIANVDQWDYYDFMCYLYGHHPSRGPGGTTFDRVNYKFNGTRPFSQAAMMTVQFGSPEFIQKFYGPTNPKKVSGDPLEITKLVKDFARYLGADQVGIANLSPDPQKWFFKKDQAGNPLHYPSQENKYAIVCVHEEELATHPFPHGPNLDTIKYYTKVSRGYFLDDYIAGQLAEFIRALGYHASGHNNGHVRSVPLAILAGLGEMGRTGLLLTTRWGPNVRINTVTTDLPLIPDKPIDIGVRDMCSMCTRCYDYCPARAIPVEEMDYMGVKKWKVNLWRCRRSTVIGMQNESDACTCSICRDVCPWAKPERFWINRMGRLMASRSHIGRKFLVRLDDWLYTKWNKHNLRDILTERRSRIKESYRKFPDVSELWMTEGAYSSEARSRAKELSKNPFGSARSIVWDEPGMVMFPFFDINSTELGGFGEWPEWSDPWGRTVKNAPALDFISTSMQRTGNIPQSGEGSLIFPDQPPKGLGYWIYAPVSNKLFGSYGL